MDTGCDWVREAVSARIDGEDPGLPPGVLEAHLAECAACQEWEQRAYVVTRRVRLGGRYPGHDLTARVLAAVPSQAAWRRRVQRAGLLAVALAQLAITVPLLILGHDHGAGTHAAHELGSFDLALAAAFAIGALRPALSAGLAWPCGIASAGLVATAIFDLIGGQTIGADEAQHLVAVAGAALLFWQVRTESRRPAQDRPATAELPWREPSATAGAPRRESPPEPPGGGATAARAGTEAVA